VTVLPPPGVDAAVGSDDDVPHWAGVSAWAHSDFRRLARIGGFLGRNHNCVSLQGGMHDGRGVL
jgi:hypothetical protein